VCFLQITMNPVEDLPPGVVKVAQKVVLDLLPTKSREIYETTYNRFIKRCSRSQILNDKSKFITLIKGLHFINSFRSL
jgi:hypothetical protein